MDRRIEAVISYMESHLSEPLITETLAERVNLSTSRLRHLFKEETGRTPSQHLKALRLLRAEFLLRTTFLSVKEIASMIGLGSSNFVREFKAKYKLTPTSFRDSIIRHSGPNPKKRG